MGPWRLRHQRTVRELYRRASIRPTLLTSHLRKLEYGVHFELFLTWRAASKYRLSICAGLLLLWAWLLTWDLWARPVARRYRCDLGLVVTSISLDLEVRDMCTMGQVFLGTQS